MNQYPIELRNLTLVLGMHFYQAKESVSISLYQLCKSDQILSDVDGFQMQENKNMLLKLIPAQVKCLDMKCMKLTRLGPPTI